MTKKKVRVLDSHFDIKNLLLNVAVVSVIVFVAIVAIASFYFILFYFFLFLRFLYILPFLFLFWFRYVFLMDLMRKCEVCFCSSLSDLLFFFSQRAFVNVPPLPYRCTSELTM